MFCRTCLVIIAASSLMSSGHAFGMVCSRNGSDSFKYMESLAIPNRSDADAKAFHDERVKSLEAKVDSKKYDERSTQRLETTISTIWQAGLEIVDSGFCGNQNYDEIFLKFANGRVLSLVLTPGHN